jgi:hypothetical protein
MTKRFIRVAEKAGVLESFQGESWVVENITPEMILKFGEHVKQLCVAQLALTALANTEDVELNEIMDLAITNIHNYWESQ